VSDDDESADVTPQRFRTLRFNPLRDVLPWLAVAVGAFQTIRAATGAMDSIFLIVGPVLVVIGISGFLLALWMKKRGS
jgi:spore maturation protein SpmB